MTNELLQLNADRTIVLNGTYWNGGPVPKLNVRHTYSVPWTAVCERLYALHEPSEQRSPAPVRATPARREGRSTRGPGREPTVNRELSEALLAVLMGELTSED